MNHVKSQSIILMQQDGATPLAIKSFERVFAAWESNASQIIPDSDIEPLESVQSLAELHTDLKDLGNANLGKLAVLKLNGGLGTGMGCVGPKSEIQVKEGFTFNDVIARQIQAASKNCGVEIPLIHLTSFNTDDAIQSKIKSNVKSGMPYGTAVLQNRFPKLYAKTHVPTKDPEEFKNWYPPGHGDLYSVLYERGVIDGLLKAGKEFLFISNIDNLGATIDPTILGYMLENKLSFLMEVAERTQADSKGGHLALHKASQRLLLRERASAPVDSEGNITGDFSDIARYGNFNTNNIWIHLPALKELLDAHHGVLPLPVIVNKNKLNPRDPDSPSVVQLECACGTALPLFENASLLRVPRSRFAPVKGSSDLLVVMSDAYQLNDSYELVSRTPTGIPPHVQLSREYQHFDQMMKRFKVIPSLQAARSFSVAGDVTFAHHVKVIGSAQVKSVGEGAVEFPGEVAVLDKDCCIQKLK